MLWSGHALVVAAISPISYVLVLHAMKAAPLSHPRARFRCCSPR